MKIRKKKKGSTFVTVVVVMAIIFTTGTTILAVTANDYKMRINQSKKLQNLYEADSGLDVVENIIIKTSQEAIKYADKEVKKKFTELDDKDRSKDKINEIFKDKFYEFLTVRNKEILNEKEVEILEYLILEKKYIKSILESGKLEYDSAISNIENRFIIEIPEGGYVKNINNGKVSNITIEVKSNFESTEGQLKNKKTVSTKYSITAPDYNSEITSINIYPVFDGKAITADGNMNIESLGNKSIVNISGDIWVQGNNNLGNSPEYTFDKYIGGIKLDNTSFDINGNIYTANTFHLNNLVNESSVNGDIYAKNIYIGKSINSNVSKLNNISFEKNVVVNNDLALNATNSSIVIKNNFYGINEKTTEVSTANKALSSSSIIVNDTSNTSTITVNKDSYIMGVAYLNATDESGNKYQTGESVAVKGNYLAYTDVDDVLNGATNVTLKYYSPLQLLESKNGQSNAIMKADYFAEYYSKNNNSYNFNDGGVSLKKSVKSVGASVKDNQGNIQKSNINDSDISIVNEQRNEFARNVFAMGDTTGLGYDLYDGQEVKRQVSNQVNFNEIRRVQGSSFDTTEGMVILKGNENENIEIENGKIKGTDIELSKGLIIANGDITIDGNFNFTGNIITTGNIILKGEGEKNITYDPQVVRSILALNYDLLKDIFVKSQGDREEVKVTSASELYSVDKFLTKSLWRIVK
ncbi:MULTISPECIES: hypothetical protein [Clostridium]|uniref:Uncharacterized protein n=1 Tax=Clostridium tertium TaxID=1559 RepID=A0A9X4B039_9CLOT|nr:MULTISPECIES: hypothetical protein [Clostridium]MDB1935316.1 hypothetical protein [Clostridium tertium]MDB1939037.1 hypothetical protein [Clostridium tertium]MDB1939348.1 hypothetical protein [Clostridium tertium]MDB1955069.1 hypothetical protein [Clostridium tertium]MDB1957889.1 hypothetical protein [Clostridium tertium]